jgi:transposase
MISTKFTQQKYTDFSTNIQLVLPLNFEVLIPEDDSVRLLSHIVEELDFRNLSLAYSSLGRNPAVPPRVLFQILVYAYMNGLYSSRKIEQACRRDINFMWLLENHKAPDHNTIARFRKERLTPFLEDLFCQFVLKLYEFSEIGFENIFIDGTKIEANANKYTFVWKKAVERYEARIPEKVAALAKKVNAAYYTVFPAECFSDPCSLLRQLAEFLEEERIKSGIPFVTGKGHHKSMNQRLLEEVLSLLEQKEKYEQYGQLFSDRNSFSKTDTDATFMHMKEDHMRNSQLKPGYNLQIGVESGYVVGIDLSSERNDVNTLIPFLNRLHRNFPEHSYPNIVTDAGYESEENYQFLKGKNQIAYIKPKQYDQWKRRSFKKDISKRENMSYDPKKDEYTCSQGRTLSVISVHKSTPRKGTYEREMTRYECESCEGCPVKGKCTKAKGNRQIEVSKRFLELQQESLANIRSEKGIVLRVNRSIQAEGTFGAIKEDHGFRRFLTRGKENVFTEFLLLCFGFNISKLHNKLQGRGTPVSLYEPKAA